MGRAETTLTKHMVEDGKALYGQRLVIVKYHGNEYSRAGVSDLLGCLDGAFFAVEVKAPESYGGSIERAHERGPSVLQTAFIGHVLDAGGVGAVCVTRAEFLETLAEVDRRNRETCVYCEFPEEYEMEMNTCPIHPPIRPTRIS